MDLVSWVESGGFGGYQTEHFNIFVMVSSSYVHWLHPRTGHSLR